MDLYHGGWQETWIQKLTSYYSKPYSDRDDDQVPAGNACCSHVFLRSNCYKSVI